MTDQLTNDDLDSILSEIESEETVEELTSGASAPEVKTFINTEQLRQDIAFNEDNIQVAFMNQAGLYVHYAQGAHRAKHQADKLKHRLDVLESRLDGAIRKEAAETKQKLTEGAIASKIKLHPEHVELTEKYLEARTIAELSKDVLEAWRHRRDMLVQFGADVRQERSGELRMRDKEETPSERAKRIAGAKSA